MGLNEEREKNKSAALALDTIRLERLAVRGLGAEATSISAARVYIDRLRQSYADWSPFDAESSRDFEQALMAVIDDEARGGSSVEPKVTKSEVASEFPKSLGPIEGEMWATIRIEINPEAYDVSTQERCLGTNLEYRDAKALVDAHNASIQRVADLGEPRDENGPRSQQVR